MAMYTIYWLDGNRQVVVGEGISDACHRAGCNAGAMQMIDFFCTGIDRSYGWDSDFKKWIKGLKPPAPTAIKRDPPASIQIRQRQLYIC